MTTSTPTAAQRAASIKTNISCVDSCSSTTVNDLQKLLNPILTVSKATTASSKSIRPKAPLPKSAAGAKTSSKRPTSSNSTSDQSFSLSARERFVLATEIVNSCLKVFTACVKSSGAAQRSAPSKGKGDVSPIDTRPLKERPLNRTPSSPNKAIQTSASCTNEQRAGLVSVAECCREGFAYLRSIEKGAEASQMPFLQVDKGTSALIGKLITLKMPVLALKELRILRKRLLNHLSHSDAETLEATPSPNSSKASTPSLLDFGAKWEGEAPVLDLVLQTQLQILKYLASNPSSDHLGPLEAIMNTEKDTSPINVILKTQQAGIPPTKAAQQLETMAQILLNICQQSFDPSHAEGSSTTSIFLLRCYALEARFRYWDLVAHRGSIPTEVVAPFSKFLSNFAIQSKASPKEKYETAKRCYNRINTILQRTKRLTEKESGLAEGEWLKVYQTLGMIAKESDDIPEAVTWAQQSFKTQIHRDTRDAAFQSCAIRVAALNLRLHRIQPASELKVLIQGIEEAIAGLNESIRGDSTELSTLLTEAVQFRKASIDFLNDSQLNSENHEESKALQSACCRAILGSLRFCRKYIGTSPEEGGDVKKQLQFRQRLTFALKWCFGTIDATLWAARFQVDRNLSTWEEIKSTLTATLDLLETLSTEDPQPNVGVYYSKISNLYWLYYKRLCAQPGLAHGKLAIHSVQKSIDVLRKRPESERIAASIHLKFEKLAALLNHNGRHSEAVEALDSALHLYFEDPCVTDTLHTAASSAPANVAWSSNEQTLALKRCLTTRSRITATSPEQLPMLNFEKHSSVKQSVRGLCLELAASECSSILSKSGGTTQDSVPALFRTLLEIYTPAEYPIRRLRVQLCILSISIECPRLISEDLLSNIDALNSSDMPKVLGLDKELRRFYPQISTTIQLAKAIQSRADGMTFVKSMMDNLHKTICTDPTDTIDNPALLISHLNSISQYCNIHGHCRLRISVLETSQLMQGQCQGFDSTDVIETKIALALQYMELGGSKKTKAVLDEALALSKQAKISPETDLKLRFALTEYNLMEHNLPESAEIFGQACEVAVNEPDFQAWQSSSSLARKMANNMLLAQCWSLRARLSFERDRDPQSATFNRTSIRLLHRAWACLENSPGFKAKASKDGSSKPSDDDNTAAPGPIVLFATHDSFQQPEFWNLAIVLFKALMFQANLFVHNGLFREAIYYIDQAKRIAESTRSNLLISEVSIARGEFLCRSGDLEDGCTTLDKASTLVMEDEPLLHDITLHCAIGYSHGRKKLWNHELKSYEQADLIAKGLASNRPWTSCDLVDIQSLEANLSTLTLNSKTIPKKGPTSRTIRGKKTAAPAARARMPKTNPAMDPKPEGTLDNSTQLLRARARIFQRKAASFLDQSKPDHAYAVLQELEKMSFTSSESLLQNLTQARLYLHKANSSMSSDAVYCILQDSTIATPSLSIANSTLSSESVARKISIPSKKASPKSGVRSRQQRGSSVEKFEDLFAKAGDLLGDSYHNAITSGATTTLRPLSSLLSSTSMLLSTMTTVQSPASVDSFKIASILEMSRVASFQREKVIFATTEENSSSEICSWPRMPSNVQSSRSPLELNAEVPHFRNDYLEMIPKDWTVVSLSLNEAKDEFLLCKMRASQTPFVVRLPVDRQSSREVADDAFTFDHGKTELQEIIKLANKSTHDARDMTKKATKAVWWAEREALDNRLKNLVSAIESFWLGGFRGILSQQPRQMDLLDRFQESLQDILDKNLPSRRKPKKGKMNRTLFDYHVLELFVGLGNPEDGAIEVDEALMDLLYFVIDVLQFNGERNAYDEVDFDALTVETIDALKSYHIQASSSENREPHTILLLDNALQCFPWESLPCLQGQSISRLPSLACLRNRLKGGTTVQRSSGAYVLNPSGDLKSTESTFTPHFSALDSWSSIVGRAPSETDIRTALTESDIYLYFGHGGGEQFIRSRTIKKLDKCAVTFLMGCSSGAMTEQGEYEPHGTPRNYMLAGCPALVATLWDVTDRDIDRFAEEAFVRWGLIGDNKEPVIVPKTPGRKGKKEIYVAPPERVAQQSLTKAVAKSRSACVLKYLNGAAPIVWGIPMHLSD